MKKLSISMLAVLTIAAVSCNKKNNQQEPVTEDAKKDVKLITMSEGFSMDIETVYESGYGFIIGGVPGGPGGPGGPGSGPGGPGGGPGAGLGSLGPCAIVTLDTSTAGVKILTIDFGTEGCMCADGKFRKGKVIATATHFDSLNVERHIVTENYFVNDNSIVADITRTITKIPSATTRNVVVNESLTITPAGSTTSFTRNANLTRIHNYGVVGDPSDNTTTTFGVVNVTKLSGLSITRTVEEATPLFYKQSCHQTVSGIATIVRGTNTFTVDFGSGECDGTATVSNGTSTWTIDL